MFPSMNPVPPSSIAGLASALRWWRCDEQQMAAMNQASSKLSIRRCELILSFGSWKNLTQQSNQTVKAAKTN